MTGEISVASHEACRSARSDRPRGQRQTSADGTGARSDGAWLCPSADHRRPLRAGNEWSRHSDLNRGPGVYETRPLRPSGSAERVFHAHNRALSSGRINRRTTATVAITAATVAPPPTHLPVSTSARRLASSRSAVTRLPSSGESLSDKNGCLATFRRSVDAHRRMALVCGACQLV